MGTNNDACCNVSNRPHHFTELNNPQLSISLAIAFTVPILASTLAFIVYALLGNSMNPAIIFTSLSLFSLLRQPLMFLPRSLAAITDGWNALGRLQKVFMADTLPQVEFTDPEVNGVRPYSIRVDNGALRG